MQLIDIQKDYDTVISLGGSCQVVAQMARHSLRTFSGPIDWFIFSSVQLLTKAIDSGFKGFMDYQNLDIISSTDTNYVVRDSVFDCYSYHDFPLSCNGDISSHYPIFKEKIDRRIQRFYQKLKDKESILFIRLIGNSDDIRELAGVLGSLVKSDFTLLLVNHCTEQTVKEIALDIPKVCSVEIYNPENLWSGCDRDWDVLLKGVNTLDYLSSDYNVFYG